MERIGLVLRLRTLGATDATHSVTAFLNGFHGNSFVHALRVRGCESTCETLRRFLKKKKNDNTAT